MENDFYENSPLEDIAEALNFCRLDYYKLYEIGRASCRERV